MFSAPLSWSIAAYILYTHMMAQRRKVMKAAKTQGQKAQ